jgi:hypothetical protein
MTSSPLQLTFTAPDGTTTVFNGSADLDAGPMILPASGTYTATIEASDSTSAGSYGFRILDLSAAPVLPFNTTVTGTLNPGLAAQIDRVNGTLGQRLVFDPQFATVPAGLTIALIKPDGTVQPLTLDPGTLKVPFTLDETGTFTLAVQSSGSAAADFSFRMWDLATAPALTLGTPVSGQLNPGAAADVYTLSGQPGEQVDFTSQTTNAPSGALWTLYGPDNTKVGGGLSLNQGFLATLPVAGLYTLVVEQPGGGNPVAYQFTPVPALSTTLPLGSTAARPGRPPGT